MRMAKLDEQKINYIMSALERLHYGSLAITIHDGEITQVDCNEKHRFMLSQKQSSKRKDDAASINYLR
jgi:hypothetical protein